MCILCVIQKWSRRVATMLPWLVLPLIGLWALSQLLPPAFRFEITSPRLACVFVLLVTLFWYEVLMPQLSTWRVRRNARLRERKRFEAMELQKLKKTATRRCRNCSTPYRDQNPGGGRFMCSYCGHISKRPVLDIPVPPGLGLSGSGILKDLVGRGGKMLNGKGWNENGWMHGPEWSENSTWTSESTYWRNNSGSTFGEDENCLGDRSYPGGVVFACRLLTSFFMSIRWLWRKIFSFSSSVDESSTDADQRRLLSRQGENGTSYHESRVEKARRKAEEKRQARLEKEHLEEEERKQREEVARLVEERRKLRDEKIEAEKCSKSSPGSKEKDIKKEAEKKRQERKKEKDKTSSKSNSDAEELDKRIGKETEHKRELDKNNHSEHQRHASDNSRSPMERRHGHGVDNNGTSNTNTTGAGGRYFDRVKGTFFSSSKAFTDNRFFGRGVNMSATIAKENKPIGSTDHSHASAHTRHINPPEFVAGKSGSNGGERNTNRPVITEPQPSGEPKKSWQQLFTRSPSVPASSSVNVISRPSTKPKTVQNSQAPCQDHSIRTFDNPISFGLPSPFTMPTYSSGSTIGSLGFSSERDIVLSQAGENARPFIPEEEHFEDPCYVPDPISLLGPISESLDLRAKFETGVGLEKPHLLKKSPIESPLSRLRVADEKQVNDGSWQMWKTTFGQDLLLPSDNTRPNEENGLHHVPHNRTSSLFAKDDPIHSTYSHRKDCFENDQRSGTFSPVAGPSNHDPWSQKMFLPASSGTESLLSLSRPEEPGPNNVAFMSPTGLAPENPFEHASPNHWLKKVKKTGDGTGRQFVEGQFLNQDVPSFW
ncbi:hypothetical protein EUTSA_v10016251mg [Eutrema salsugineum]|uniref:Uncharacterized protein n=1 Tax=Eutrema salsugineum TaxID=72664 RepID=V4NZX9_EUTSA|nr:uncharacterized protein LOC18027186 [Eutrema salsugineum]ESQ52516.1 hypothetical protein EUTSA_v10016251mg [Eutrema salsugineum]